MSANDHNERAWDSLAKRGHRFSQPPTREELDRPLHTIDAAGWYGDSIQGWEVLCLAAGGGRQGPLYAAAGAKVTVVDISAGQLEIDRRVAAEQGLQLTTIQAPMDQLSILDRGRFDLVVQPVSTCYVPQVASLFAEVARVTRGGGLYVSQHKSPQNLQVSLAPTQHGHYVIERSYYTGEPSAGHAASRLREQGTLEYVHTLETLLGGICKAGFVLEGFVEPQHADPDGSIGSFGHRCQYVAPYLRVKARRLGPTGWVP